MYETARSTLSNQLERLRTNAEATEREIDNAQDQLTLYRQKHKDLTAEIKEVAEALVQLGGPLPDWTNDKALISFWEELKDGQ